MLVWVGSGSDIPERAADVCEWKEISVRNGSKHSDISEKSLTFIEQTISHTKQNTALTPEGYNKKNDNHKITWLQAVGADPYGSYRP